MCTYIKFFSACLYIALAAKLSKFAPGVQKRLGTNKCVRTKSHTGSKVSKISFGLMCTWENVVVHLYCGFSVRRQMAPQQSAIFRTAFFGQFFLPVWGRIELPIMHRFERCLRFLLEDQMYFATQLLFRSSVGKWRHKIRKTAVEIFQNVSNRTPSLCQILPTVTIEIVINSNHVAQHFALHPVGISVYRTAFKVMLLISS